ncbi:MAG: bifunctional 4-hydroxy-2-oxoglutarate aldolase/2-dehydro-3-deoxy-phosphogluconate aldolase [Verrucomicrobiaceae bacterium]|nr:bifunctional 4-hydroxy-2-oxoglutarate aldolase/2-dehydro-3-deoxy-phosphogluconate aldolase [Verrucomicrobiaceae bacterium]
MTHLFNPALLKTLRSSGVVAVMILKDPDSAVPVARALVKGGVNCVELTLRTQAAIECVRRIRGEVPEMTVGVGTILSPVQVDEALAAGAHFGVSPGTNPRVIQAAREVGLPFAPGVCTPSDIEAALEFDCRLLKFFPAEPSGGLPYLRAVAAPFAHLGVRFIPLGGVGPHNAADYLQETSVHALGGSWLAPQTLIESERWDAIERLASEARAIVDSTLTEKT